MRANRFDIDDSFYCVVCGGKAFSIPRQRARKKEKGHKKLMYCWHCGHTVNHIWCPSPEEVEDFKTAFARGDYAQEAKEELEFERNNQV